MSASFNVRVRVFVDEHILPHILLKAWIKMQLFMLSEGN